MGIRTGSRVNGNTTTPTPPADPKVVVVNDSNYRGKNPDQLSYPHVESITTPDGSVELRAFTEEAMEELRSIARDQFLPTLRHHGLNCEVLCQMPERNTSALGVCFNAGRSAQDAGEKQQIMLHHPDAANSRVSYTLLHEVAHLNENGHGSSYRAEFGRILDWSVGRGTPFTDRRDDLLATAKADTYAPPTPVRATWDSYDRPDSPRGRTPVLKRGTRHIRPMSNAKVQRGAATDVQDSDTEAGR